MSPHRDTGAKPGTHTAGPEFTDPNAPQQPARTVAGTSGSDQEGARQGYVQDPPPSNSRALQRAAQPAGANRALGPVAWAILGLAAIVVLAAVLVAIGVL